MFDEEVDDVIGCIFVRDLVIILIVKLVFDCWICLLICIGGVWLKCVEVDG